MQLTNPSTGSPSEHLYSFSRAAMGLLAASMIKADNHVLVDEYGWNIDSSMRWINVLQLDIDLVCLCHGEEHFRELWGLLSVYCIAYFFLHFPLFLLMKNSAE